MTKLNSSFMIGNVEIPHRTVLAPMAGVTNSAFRTIAKEFGAGLVVMEMISEKGLLYNNEKTLHMLHIPLTVKMRTGWSDSDLAVENALAAESAGVSALAMHGRTREQMYTGHCDHETLARVAKAITKIPFIGNGDVRNVQDAKLMIEELGVDAVMVGRAAMNNPYIFTQINHFFETGEELPDLPFDKKLDIAEDHLKRLVDLKGEMIAVREFRGLAPHYLRGTAGAAKVRGEVSRAESVAQVKEIFATLR